MLIRNGKRWLAEKTTHFEVDVIELMMNDHEAVRHPLDEYCEGVRIREVGPKHHSTYMYPTPIRWVHVDVW
jgi:hypothetical protein